LKALRNPPLCLRAPFVQPLRTRFARRTDSGGNFQSLNGF
jgi:hypothetical protein